MSIVETISYELWDKDPEAFAHQLGINHKLSGFCGITDHPIPNSLVSDSIEMFSTFFSLSEDIKMQYFLQELGGARGYTPYRIETPKGGQHADLKNSGKWEENYQLIIHIENICLIISMQTKLKNLKQE